MSVLLLDVTRRHFTDWYRRNRARTAELFSLIDPAAWEARPIPLRHPFAFYAGHLPAFSFLTLNRRILREAAIDPELEKLYERGIDPSSQEAAGKHVRSSWPSIEEVADFARACDERVIDALTKAPLNEQAAYTLLEHEQMHQETLMYIVTQLEPALKHGPAATIRDDRDPNNEWCTVPQGFAVLGANRDEVAFGWDNEFDQHEVQVPAFAMQRYPITNGAYLEFVRAGGPLPPFWIERDGTYSLRATFDEIPLPRSWPVWLSHDRALAYAQWMGKSLPTEAEYHRAVLGAPSPSVSHGNFDFARYDADSVTAHPDGRSAWGIEDLVGNGWEMTQTIFAPFPGFEPMPTYRQYSADFFDGRHMVYKGGSPVTARELLRRSFRNWFYADYPYAYGKFRLVDKI